MADIKTKVTDASVEQYLAARAKGMQLEDCTRLMALFGRVTGEAPRMWGPSIVGYGRYRYRYESGHQGEMCIAGFAIRGRELVVYLTAESPDQQARLATLGKHRFGKSCLYFKRLADIDIATLEALIVESIAETRRRYPTGR